jgi:hypothetical protein
MWTLLQLLTTHITTRQIQEVWRFLKKLKIEVPYHPVIQLLGINPNKGKTGYSRDTYTPMFIATLFT